MNERNTLPSPVVSCTTPEQRAPRFGWGWAIIAILIFLIVTFMSMCSSVPTDYSRLRSQSVAITTTERTVPQ